MLRSLRELYTETDLANKLEQKGLLEIIDERLNISSLPQNKTYKIRLIYDGKGIERLEAQSYTPLELQHLYLHHVTNDFSYAHKALNRDCLNPFDDTNRIPLFIRDGLLTDSSFSNIILEIKGELWTPQRPLLRGVMRGHLLDKRLIKEANLSLEDLAQASSIYLINAMLPLERAIKLSPQQIIGLKNP